MKVLLVLLLLASRVWATTYYVDYVNGSNQANGQGTTPCSSPANCTGPWKTPPGAYCPGNRLHINGTQANWCKTEDTGASAWTTKVFTGGDQILLTAGQSHPYLWWINSEHFDPAAGSDILIDKTGAGANPLMEGGDLNTALEEATVGNNGFTVEDSANNIYSTKVCLSATAPCLHDRLFYGCNATGSTGEQPQLLRSKASVEGGIYERFAKGGGDLTGFTPGFTCTAAAGGLTAMGRIAIDCANNKICVRTDNATTYQVGSDPRSDGSTWYIGYRIGGILISSIPHININHIDFRHSDLVTLNQYISGEVTLDNSQAPPDNLTVQNTTSTNSGGAGVNAFLSGVTRNGINFTFSNNTWTRSFAYGITVNNLDATTVANWKINNNTATYNGDHGISGASINTLVIDQNVTHHNDVGDTQCGIGPCGGNGQNSGGGIYLATRGAVENKNVSITRNISYANGPLTTWTYPCNETNPGIGMGDMTGTFLLANNVSYLNQGPGLLINPNASFASNQGIYHIYNNTTANNGCEEFEMNEGHDGVAPNGMDVRNNLFYRDANYPGAPTFATGYSTVIWIPYAQPLGGWTWDYNLVRVLASPTCSTSPPVHNCYWFDNVAYQPGPPTGFDVHGVNCTPSFVNIGTGDFRLNPSDTCAVDKGTNLSPSVVDDLLLVPRPQPPAGAYDIGAYEATATSTSTSTSTSVTTSSSTSTSSTSSSTTSTSTSTTTSSTAPPLATRTRVI